MQQSTESGKLEIRTLPNDGHFGSLIDKGNIYARQAPKYSKLPLNLKFLEFYSTANDLLARIC